MKKLLLALGVLGLVCLGTNSYALRALDSSNKTVFNTALVSSQLNGQTAFITGSTTITATNAGQFCSGLGAFAFTGNSDGTLMNCGSTPITGISLSGGASGGTVTIYDVNTNGTSIANTGTAEVSGAEVVFEATVAASTQNYYDLSNDPILTTNGVVAYATSTSGVVVYTSKQMAVNQ